MVVVQSVTPQIEFISYKNGAVYQEFSASSNYVSGMNLQSYQYQRSVNSFGSAFSITVKETSNNDLLETRAPFLDRVHTLDVVKIKENDLGSVNFVGVVTNIAYTASENSKLITISGKGIEFLLEYFTIALDASAMAWTGSENVMTNARNLEYKATDGGDGPAKISDVVNKSFNFFCEVATGAEKISNIKVKELIEKYMKNGASLLDGSSNLEFQFPISSNLLQNSTINWVNYIRNLLPEAVYEMYAIVINGVTKLKIRQMPYSASDWVNLPCVKIEDYSVVNYSLQKSIDEVYTNFYSYVEGTALSPEFWNNLTATTQGNMRSVTLTDKVKLYGYKPLQCNFIGFNTESNVDIRARFAALNNTLADWYGRLDEMLTGTLTIINIEGKRHAKIGERISFLGGQFYINTEIHNWNYGSSPTISYHLDRGGRYSTTGNFSELTGLSKALAELNNDN